METESIVRTDGDAHNIIKPMIKPYRTVYK
jgi:hypothetical protein